MGLDAGQPYRRLRNGLRLRHRDVRRAGPVAPAVHPGIHPPGAEHIHRDIVRAQFFRQAQIGPFQRRFGQRIAHPPRPVAQRRPGGDAADGAAALLRLHRRNDILGQQHRRPQIDGDSPVEQLFVQFRHRGFAVDADVGHHYIDAPEMLQSFPHQALQIGGLGHIAAHRQGLAAGLGHPPGGIADGAGGVAGEFRLRRLVGFGAGGHHHLGAGAGQGQADSPPDAPAAAGHHRHFAGKGGGIGVGRRCCCGHCAVES